MLEIASCSSYKYSSTNFEGLFSTKVTISHVKLHVKSNATKIPRESTLDITLTLPFSQHDREFFCLLQYFAWNSSSDTQGQSVGSGERARRKFSSTGERAPGYKLSPNYFQKFKRMAAPDWAQKMLCIIVPNRRTVSPEFFS